MCHYGPVVDDGVHVRVLENSETALRLGIKAERERRPIKQKFCIISQAAKPLFCFLNETFSTPTVSTPLESVFN